MSSILIVQIYIFLRKGKKMYRCIASLNGKLALILARSRRIKKSGISDFQILVLFFPLMVEFYGMLFPPELRCSDVLALNHLCESVPELFSEVPDWSNLFIIIPTIITQIQCIPWPVLGPLNWGKDLISSK